MMPIQSEHKGYGYGCSKWKNKGIYQTRQMMQKSGTCQNCGKPRRSGKYCIDCRRTRIEQQKEKTRQKRIERKRMKGAGDGFTRMAGKI